MRSKVTIIVLALCVLIGGWLLLRGLMRQGSTQVLAQTIDVRFDDTGETIAMARGRVERLILSRAIAGKDLDPAVGIENPKTGKQTGFPVDRALWERLIHDAREAAGRAKAPAEKSP